MNPRNATPSRSLRHQNQCQIVDRFEQHRSLLRYIRLTYEKPLKPLLTLHQMSTLFGNIKQLFAVYEKINKLMILATTKVKDDDSRFEKSLDHLFTGKIGKALQFESTKFCVTRREAARVSFIVHLGENPKIAPLLDANLSSSLTPLSNHNLDILLEMVTNFVTEYPLLLDLLLQETPFNTMAYLHLEQALNRVRDMSKVITEAKDFLCDVNNHISRKHSSFFASLWQLLVSKKI